MTWNHLIPAEVFSNTPENDPRLLHISVHQHVGYHYVASSFSDYINGVIIDGNFYPYIPNVALLTKADECVYNDDFALVGSEANGDLRAAYDYAIDYHLVFFMIEFGSHTNESPFEPFVLKVATAFIMEEYFR